MTATPNPSGVSRSLPGNSVSRLLLDGGAAALLCVLLVGVYVLDRGGGGAAPPPPPPPPPPEVPADPPVTLDIEKFLPPIDPEPRVKVSGWTDTGRFGVMTTSGDPKDPSDDDKKLTYSEQGGTSNTCVWVDDATPLFGSSDGEWHERIGRRDDGRVTCAWDYKGIRFEQSVQLVAGEVSRRMDTLRITYTMTNTDDRAHVVGLRVLIDTLIGGNDGVPFRAPSRADAIIREPTTFIGDEVPPYLHAMQSDNLEQPGVIVNIDGLRPTSGEAPSEVVLSHWPGGEAPWMYDRKQSFGSDTALGLYYAPKPLGRQQTRTVSFTYGLATQSRGKVLTLTPGQAPKAGGEFYLNSLVQPPKEGQTVTLTLPEGMKVKDLAKKTQSVPAQGPFQQINWLVQVDRNALGPMEAHVRLEPDGIEAKTVLNVQPADSKLFLRASPMTKIGPRGFWVSGYVHAPKAGQTVELQVSGVAGVALHPDKPAIQPVSQADKGGYGHAFWWVTAESSASGTVELTVLLRSGDGTDPLRASTSVTVKRRSVVE
jgi:hypothetical protein